MTKTLQELQERELLTYSRGSINIIRRQGLEELSCECYRTVTAEHAKLLD